PTGLTEFLVPQASRANEGEITDVSDIMELVDDETEAMSLRDVGDEPQEAPPPDDDSASDEESTAKPAAKRARKAKKSSGEKKKSKKSKKSKK
ncbi:MAG: hypothetical protein QF464_19480, partial [Myxococcota bacterium]|nr:hypothetical protein [Myxococcota bacterium]